MSILKTFLISVAVIFLFFVIFLLFKLFTDNYPKNTETTNTVNIPIAGEETGSQYLTENIKESLKDYKGYISNPDNSAASDIFSKKIAYFQMLATSLPNENSANKKDNIISALDGLYGLYKNNQTNKEMTSYLSTRNAVVARNVFYYSCYRYQWLEQSKWSSEPDYQNFVFKYGNGPQPALMFFDKLLSETTYSDKYVSSIKIFTTAQILHNFGNKLDSADKAFYVNKLSKEISKYPTESETRIYDYILFKEIMPATYLAYGLDVLSQYDSSVSSEKVKENYISTRKFVDSKIVSKSDRAQESKIFLNNVYAGFLFDQNKQVVNNEIVEVVKNSVELNSNLIASDKDMYVNGKTYYENAITDMGSWDKIRARLVMIAKQDDNQKNYFKYFGVSIK